MSPPLNVPIGQPYQIPLYLRTASDVFGDDYVRHILVNVYITDLGNVPGSARAQCLVMKHERRNASGREGVGASIPDRPGTQVFLPKDLFESPVYILLSRVDADNDPFVQVIRLSFAVTSIEGRAHITLRTRTETFGGVSWEPSVAFMRSTATVFSNNSPPLVAPVDDAVVETEEDVHSDVEPEN